MCHLWAGTRPSVPGWPLSGRLWQLLDDPSLRATGGDRRVPIQEQCGSPEGQRVRAGRTASRWWTDTRPWVRPPSQALPAQAHRVLLLDDKQQLEILNFVSGMGFVSEVLRGSEPGLRFGLSPPPVRASQPPAPLSRTLLGLLSRPHT